MQLPYTLVCQQSKKCTKSNYCRVIKFSHQIQIRKVTCKVLIHGKHLYALHSLDFTDPAVLSC